MDTGSGQVAAIYARQSHGKERSIEEQLELGHARCGEHEWPVAGEYIDRISASRFARKPREDWPRLIADLEAGRLGKLWMYESSRGDRDPESWMGLLRRCRTTHTLIYVETHERLYDMANARDWRTLADEGIDSAYESEKTSLRVRRDLRKNAMKGRPHGVTLYGYERIYDDHKARTLKEQRPHADHAPVVREVFERIAAGEPLSWIVNGLNERGVPSPRGAKWGRTTLRQLAVNPGYIGKRGNHGQPVAALPDAIWPPLITLDTWNTVQARLAAQATGKTIPGRLRHLCSYLATCGECGAPLCAYGPSYGCSAGGCTYIRKDWLDEYVTELAIAWLRKYGRDMLTPASKDADALAAQAEVLELRGRHEALSDQAARGEITGALLARTEKSLLAMIAAAEERIRHATVSPALRALAADPEFAREVWEETTLPVKREVIRALMTITVHKPARPGRQAAFDPLADPHRVVITWRDWKAEGLG